MARSVGFVAVKKASAVSPKGTYEQKVILKRARDTLFANSCYYFATKHRHSRLFYLTYINLY